MDARVKTTPRRSIPTDQPTKDHIMTMNKTDIAVAVYDIHTQAESAVKALQRAGFDMKKISIIGRDDHTEEHVVGFLNAGDRAKIFGKLGAFWGGLMGVLFGSALFFVPVVPTMSELGFPLMKNGSWQGIFFPKRTLRAIV
jgi:hypothetical protein